MLPVEEGERGGPVFLLRIFANTNIEMGSSLEEKTEPLVVLKQSRLKVGGHSFSAFEKYQH